MQRQLEVYKNPWALDLVREQVSKVSLEITMLDKLEQRVMNQVGKYLLTPKGSIRHRKYIRKIVLQEVNSSKKLYRTEKAELMSNITITNEDGHDVEYDPVDVLANVDSGQLELKETITLLAKSDRRKELILNAWTDGYSDDTELSHILADVLTGQATGHLSYIKRFRRICRTELLAQAI